MRRIKWITLGVPLAVCLSGLFEGPALAQECETLDGVPNCDTYNVLTGQPCKVQADCLNAEFNSCGAQRVYASVSLPQGASCSVGTGFVRECGPDCGGLAWAEAWIKGRMVAEMTEYCCDGCL